jgi:uncharacterized membrane protein YbhN (UPF0104 family)/2-polyprenyl-3-methyl-5-hydroxy-6-metoxy-1,4-benzoquinol methylase
MEKIVNFWNKYNKYLFHLINFVLFISLIIFSVKYWPLFKENLLKADLSLLFLSLLTISLISVSITIRWLLLLKPFNKGLRLKMSHFKRIYCITNGSNIYKYVPPKGINYLVRVKFANKLQGLKTTIFSEFYTDMYLFSVCLLIFILNYFFISSYVLYLTLLFIFISTIFLVEPKLVIKVMNFFRVKLEKIRRLIFYLQKLSKTKEYYYSVLLAIFSMFLYGTSLYFIILSFGLVPFSIFTLTIIFFSAQFVSSFLMSPGGIGVRDIGIVTLLSYVGMPVSDAIMVSLSHRVLIFFTEAVIGLTSIMVLKRKSGINVKEYFNQTAEDFSDLYNQSSAFKERYGIWRKFIDRYTLGKDKCLDLGCGDGVLSRYLGGKCDSVVGIDQSESMIKLAQERSKYLKGVKFLCHKLPYENHAEVNLIVCSSVIEYIPNQKEVIKNFSNLLHGDGTLLISLANKSSVFRTMERIAKKLGLANNTYLRYQKKQYSLKEAKKVFLKQGLKYLEHEYFALHSAVHKIFPRLARKVKNKYFNTQIIVAFKKV